MWLRWANRFSTSNLKIVEIDTRRNIGIAKKFKVNVNDGN